ncbi:AAI domain-containing protein [Heracleum sosnowskyi]|uniref:AAI domain-containing protein n=1 Tax=Heracleum sosnowskyi TaxID=360622 RepID=A0AAD8LYC2_9APIA|nr:AAI domain-containing protein [Heracleum sosnowskyi]
MITSFTPCLNYLTGSTGTGGSPTGDCCGALRSLTSTSMDCACLIVTGNVPVSLPINRTLAISLPKACRAAGVKGVPVQCKASGVPLPAPGPVLLGQSPPPMTAASPFSPRASKAAATTPASPPDETTSVGGPGTSIPADSPDATPGIRPVLNPTSASDPCYILSPSLLLAFAGTMILNYY